MIPESHPRYESLKMREKLARAVERGLAVKEGLIAHGRGEAFDYLIGEETIPSAELAEKVAVAHLLKAKKPVISVNGNAAALAPESIVELGEAVGAILEANVFYGDRDKRVRLIIDELVDNGAKRVLGSESDASIPGLEGQRAICSRDGIYSSDVVLVPLEDGDRARALVEMGKTVISLDLNPLSRTSQVAKVSIVDELTRALPKMTLLVEGLKDDLPLMNKIIMGFNNGENLSSILEFIAKRLDEL
jgi:4-phosphopantoate--beta-alanine ligase